MDQEKIKMMIQVGIGNDSETKSVAFKEERDGLLPGKQKNLRQMTFRH